MKKSIYIETSIPSYYYEERKELEFQRGITRQWWDGERNQYFIYISEIVMAELEAGNYPNKELILAPSDTIPRLQLLPEIEGVVEVYLKHYLMPGKNVRDAFHLAIASYYKIDYLLTWNYQHLANVNKQEHIRVINERIGLSTPQIITPLQIIFGKEKENDA